MFFDDLDAIDEAKLQGLIANHTIENQELEFKRQLDLNTDSQRREAGKDTTSMANTIGGQILYGIEEAAAPDGSKVATAIVPITDGTIDGRLSDVLASSVHPRVFPTFRRVPVAGGFVLVVQIPKSHGDLHMVTGYDTYRYYRRDNKGAVPMTEHEVRKAYEEIAMANVSLDTRLGALIEKEEAVRRKIDESIIVVPWHSTPGFMDPRQLEDPFGRYLSGELLKGFSYADYWSELRIGADGYRVLLPEGKKEHEAALYIAVMRNGLVHFSSHDALQHGQSGVLEHRSGPVLHRVVQTLLVARHICRRMRYWGPVRLSYFLRPEKEWSLNAQQYHLKKLDAKPFAAVPVDVRLEEPRSELRAAREILDQLAQVAGETANTLLDGNGDFLDERVKKEPFYKPFLHLL